MSTAKATADDLIEKLEPLNVRARAMFGEYGLYCDDKIVALICDDRLFVKPSEIAAEFAKESWLAPPYPGAKDYYKVPRARLADTAWLRRFIERTAEALPAPVRRPKQRAPMRRAKPRAPKLR